MTQTPSPIVLYRIDPTRPYFAETGADLVKMGWSVFPQTTDRRPGTVAGRAIRPITENNLGERRPYPAEIAQWSRFCGDLNVAAVMGPGSGGAVAIDLDITDEILADKIHELAIGIFGYTPLQRIGNAPKIALLYREEKCNKADTIRTRHIAAEDGGHGIDILSEGGMLTFFGNHHKTGRQFQWPKCIPLDIRPSDLPVISQNIIDKFLVAVDEIMPLRNVGVDIDREIVVGQAVAFKAKYPAPDDKNLAVVAWQAHADDSKFSDYSDISIVYAICQRMLITGWRPEHIVHAGATVFEKKQDESGYKTTISGTVKNLLTISHERDVLAKLAREGDVDGKKQFHCTNWRRLERNAGARLDPAPKPKVVVAVVSGSSPSQMRHLYTSPARAAAPMAHVYGRPRFKPPASMLPSTPAAEPAAVAIEPAPPNDRVIIMDYEF